ncbi:MAG: hypothetical protein JNL08_08050 [Planctomycetes bacterium]|nr:hypothetical protein [Planctomycetota bacterium]
MSAWRRVLLHVPVAAALAVTASYAWSRIAGSFAFAGDFQIYAGALAKAVHGDNPYLPFAIGPGFLYHPASLFLVASVGAFGPWLWNVAAALAFAVAVAVLRAAVGQPVRGPDQHVRAAGDRAGVARVAPR